MANIPAEETAVLWARLNWTTAEIEFKDARFRVHGLPNSPGLYRVSWIDAEAWGWVTKKRRVGASKRFITDPFLAFEGVAPPVMLTVGRSTWLARRFRDHFGNNEKSNRLYRRLHHILPECDVRTTAAQALKVEWVIVEDWVQRCVLEAHGKATFRPILDIDAEH